METKQNRIIIEQNTGDHWRHGGPKSPDDFEKEKNQELD